MGTVLLRLPLFYNPDATGHREPVEEEKFLDTAERALSTETCWP